MGIWSCSPYTNLAARLPQIPPAQLAYKPVFFSNWDKFDWPEQAASRMLPSHKARSGNFSQQSDNRLIELPKSPRSRACRRSVSSCNRASHWLAYPRRTPHNGLPKDWPIHCGIGIPQDVLRTLVSGGAQAIPMLTEVNTSLPPKMKGGARASSCGPRRA